MAGAAVQSLPSLSYLVAYLRGSGPEGLFSLVASIYQWKQVNCPHEMGSFDGISMCLHRRAFGRPFSIDVARNWCLV